MKTRISLVVAWIVLWCAVPRAQQVGSFGRLIIGTQPVTIASNGSGTAATATFTPLTTRVAVTCNDPDTCAVTLGETGLPGGTIGGLVASFTVELVNMSANAVTFADSAGVQELQSAVSLAQYATLTCSYMTDRWVCGNAGASGGAPTTAQYWTGAADGTLSAEKNLGALSTGLVLNTAGVPTAYTGTSCTNQFPRSLNASGAATCASVNGPTDITGVIPIANLATGTPNGSKYVRDDGVLATPAGGGDVSGPGVAVVDGHLAVWDGTSGTAIRSGGAPGGGLSASSYLKYSEQQAQNTAGGTFTSGAWRTRTLNTENADVGGLGTLGSNQITLTAGTYHITAYVPAYAVNSHQARLYNVTDAVEILPGQPNFQATTTMGFSIITGTFTIGASKALEIQHQCETTKTTNGLGVQGNFTTEVYTVVELWKIG